MSYNFSMNKRCTSCKSVLPIESFYKNKSSIDGCGHECKSCVIRRNENYRIKHPQLVATRAKARRDRYNSQGLCADCGMDVVKFGKKRCEKCCKKLSNRNVARRAKLKLEVLNAYGGTRCACCGETIMAFLSIDHINNDGHQHRENLKQEGQKSISGNTMYKWLKNNNYPPGFQVLCHNCNQGKHINGGVCPHQKEKLGSDRR